MKHETQKTRTSANYEHSHEDDENIKADTALANTLEEVDVNAVIGPALLRKLSTAMLYKLLQVKKVPGRSKLRTAEARANALTGMVTAGDMASLEIDVAAEDTTPAFPDSIHVDVPSFIREHHEMYEKYKPGEGYRIDEPVGGIDVHAIDNVYAIANPGGIILADMASNDADGIHHMAQVLRDNGVTCVAMESTAEYWLKLCWLLHAEGIHVLVANPKQTKETQGQKTDVRDAKRIALAFRDGRLKPSVLCTPEQFQLRKLSRDATDRKEQATREINALKVMYHMFDAPEWIQTLNTSARGCRILSAAPSLTNVDDILSLLATEFAHGKGMLTDGNVLLAMANQMHAFFHRVLEISGAMTRFAQHFRQYMHLREMARDLQSQILQIVGKDPAFVHNVELLITCSSVDVDTAVTFLVEIVDIRFFWHPGALVRWTGLGPRVHQSGHNKRLNGRIYKGGNKGARRSVWLAAKVDYAHYKKGGHPVGNFVAHLRSKNKAYKVAVTAGARKLLTIMYHVLVMQLPFQEVYADMENERLERNRERKQKALEKRLKEASTLDLLKALSEALPRDCIRLIEAEEQLAIRVHDMLGTRLEFASFG